MWLADTSIKRPVSIAMLVLAMVILGAVSFSDIGVDLFPEVDFPIVTITTTLKGAGPEIIDVDITDKIEGAVSAIGGIRSINSTSTESVSIVTVEFVLERDIDFAAQDVREQIAAIRGKLPRDASAPTIRKVDPGAMPIMWLALTGTGSPRELSTYANEVLKKRLQRISGVGDISLGGLRLRQIRIWLDADRLMAHHMTAHDVVRAIQRENVDIPVGRIESDTKEYAIRIKSKLLSVYEFNNLIIGYHKNAPVRLMDIGRAEDGKEEERNITRFNGTPAVGIGIQKQSGTNTVEVIERVKSELASIREAIPYGMTLQVSFDQSNFIEKSINEVWNNLFYGGMFVILTVLLFLKNIRITLISALSIPITIIATFSIMRLFDFTFNTSSMLGLALAVGILIDDAIVVIENTHRHIKTGIAPHKAASIATSEIGFAVIATTLAIVAIFIPVAFMKGIIGMFFFEFALTFVFAVVFSTFISLTLTPMLASRFLKTHQLLSAESSWLSLWHEKTYKKSVDIYTRILKITLLHRGKVLVFAAGIFAASLFIIPFIGREFVPPEDQGQFIVRLEAPTGHSVSKVDSMFRKAEDITRELQEVKSVFYVQGSMGGDINKGIMFVSLKPKAERQRSQEQIKASVRTKFMEIPGLTASAENVSMIGGGVRDVPIQYNIRGKDLLALELYAEQIAKEFSKIEGIVDVSTSLEAKKPEIRVFIDRDKAADLGVNTTAVAETINFLFGGGVEVTRFKDEARGMKYDVMMKLNPEDRASPDDIGRLYVRSMDGRLIEISNIIEIQKAGGPGAISRTDRQRSVTLFANLENIPLGEAMAKLDAISAKILPPEYSTSYMGTADMMLESFRYLISALILGIILSYMILASKFESFIHPFVVLLSVPLASIGAFAALFLTGNTINIFSFIGIILLVGLVSKIAILLVDYINTLRARGIEKKQAILSAGSVRFRPILMTTLTTIFAMAPIAIGVGEGAETRSPMAIAIIGGLLSSIVLTLVVVPAAYDLLDDLQRKFMKKAKPQRAAFNP